jgi:hydroxybutyrate-dimer hydrolase
MPNTQATARASRFLASISAGAVLVAAAALSAQADDKKADDKFVPPATILHAFYDGNANDLLTAGLGKTGLGSAAPPGFTDPLNPTAEELRRSAIYNNYRALVDPTSGGGYGVLYGPNVGIDGVPTANEGKIAGDEYIGFEHDRRGRGNVTMLVQVPTSFNPAQACIVTAPSSGSRGIYGAIATAGEWGLKHGCAVAYTDKGTGTGAHDLQNNTVNLIRGERADATAAGDNSNFTADLTPAERTAYNAATPNRFAFKHAHSKQNPEKDWGENVLDSIRFAFHVLNQKFGPRITKQNTIVIASSVSNGGGASVLAVEQDNDRLIDGLAVGEPNVNPVHKHRFWIAQDGRPLLEAHSRPLMDYITLVNVFQGCASSAPANAAAPLNLAPSAAACASLKAKGLLSAATPADQANEAQQIINDYGILPEQNLVQPGYWFANVPQSISVTYANAYGRFSVTDNLCNFSFGAPGAGIPPLAPAAVATIFGTSNGIPPTSSLGLINNAASGGPAENRVSTPDQNLDGALCLRSLAPVKKNGDHLSGDQRDQARRIDRGVDDILASGDLRGVPAIFVTGRNDGILPPNHTSRAYFGLNQIVEGKQSRLHYYEVTNAHHLDSFNQFAGYNSAYVPLHRYFIQAMDLMYDHLRNGRKLPQSQVVHTMPRGAGAPPITPANVPPISDTPLASDLITFASAHVRIPN